jgi:hypothetical protein
MSKSIGVMQTQKNAAREANEDRLWTMRDQNNVQQREKRQVAFQTPKTQARYGAACLQQKRNR